MAGPFKNMGPRLSWRPGSGLVKPVLSLFLLWIGFMPSWVRAQALTRDQFVEKLHSVYYDPRKDGLKGFRCELKSQMVDGMFSGGDILQDLFTFKLKPEFQLEYNLKELRLYPEKFQTPKAFGPMPKLDQYFGILNELRTVVWSEVYCWYVFNFWAVEGKATSVKVGFRPLSDGYRVQIEDKEGKGTFHFRADLTLDQVEVKLKGEKTLSIHMTYEKIPKGLVPHSCQWDYGNCHYEAVAHYVVRDDYFVPDEIKTTLSKSGSEAVSVYDVLHFERYKIDW